MKNFLSYAVCAGLAIVFAFVLNGRAGFLIATVLAVAAVVSLVLDELVRKKISVSFTSPPSMVGKNEHLAVSLTVEKQTFLPTPFIEITMQSSPNIKCNDSETIRLALSVSRAEPVHIKYTAIGCGNGFVGIKSVTVNDFLGFRKIPVTLSDNSLADVRVLPDIIEIPADNELEKATMTGVFDDNNDEEEETGDTSLVFNGVPGYDHREYIPGDPLKKINWKLSSKKDTYMVRLDEKPAVTSRIVLLDIPFVEKTEEYYVLVDRIIQSCLSVLACETKQGFECELHYYDNGWITYNVSTYNDIPAVQTMLASVRPLTPYERIDKSLLANGKGFTLFSSSNDPQFFEDFAHGAVSGASVCCVTDNLQNASSDNVYHVNEDYEFEKM